MPETIDEFSAADFAPQQDEFSISDFAPARPIPAADVARDINATIGAGLLPSKILTAPGVAEASAMGQEQGQRERRARSLVVRPPAGRFSDIPETPSAPPLNIAGKVLNEVQQPLEEMAGDFLRRTIWPSYQTGQPIVPPESFGGLPERIQEALIPLPQPLKEARRAVYEKASGLTTPGNAAMLPVAGESKIVQGLFGGAAAEAVPEDIEQLAKARSANEIGRGFGNLAADVGVAALIGKHALKGEPAVAPEVAPERTPTPRPTEPATQTPVAPEITPELTPAGIIEAANKAGRLTTDIAYEAGRQTKTVAHLDDLLAGLKEVTANAAEHLKAIRAETDPAKRMELMRRAFGGDLNPQYYREAIEAATDLKSASNEMRAKAGEPTWDRPLDWKKNPEVADWLRKNAKDIYEGNNYESLPDALKAKAETKSPEAMSREEFGDPLLKPGESGVSIFAGKMRPDGTLMYAREHAAGAMQTTPGIDGYLIVPKGTHEADPMLFEHNELQFGADQQSKLGIRFVSIQDADAAKGDLYAAIKSKSTQTTAPTETRLTPSDKAKTIEEKTFRATSEGQKAMASRASRIATLHGLNEAIRKAKPEEAYPRSIIDATPDSQIDSMLETLRQDYNKFAAKPAATPAVEQAAAKVEAKPRVPKAGTAAYDRLSVFAKAAAGEFESNQKIIETGKQPTGKKATAKQIAELKERQKVVLENFRREAAKPSIPKPEPIEDDAAEAEVDNLYENKSDPNRHPDDPTDQQRRDELVARMNPEQLEIHADKLGSIDRRLARERELAQGQQEIPLSEKPPTPAATPPTAEAPKAKGIAASVRNKWTSATDDAAPLGSEAGFINLDVIRDFVDSVTPHVKNAFLAVKDIARETGQLTRMTDYRRSVLGWSAKLQRSFGEAAEAQREIKSKVPDPVRQDGITNWIQADGDYALLAQRRASTEAWRDPATGKPHPQQKRLLAGYDAAISLSPEEIAVANDARDAYNALGLRGFRHNVLKSFKENYVTQVWNLARGPQGTGSSRTLKDRFKFSRASTFPTFFDGEQAGYVPKTKEIGKLLPVYIHEMNSVIAARQLVEQLSHGTASDGRPLVAPRGVGVPVEATESKPGATLVMPKVVKGGTADYRTLPNQPALNDWRWAANDTAGNPVFLKADLALHPEAYNRIKAVLGRSAIRDWYSTRTSAVAEIPKLLARGLDAANSETKRTMLGFASPFHQVQEGTHALGHRVNPAFNIPKIDLVNDAGQMDAAKHGLMMLPDRASESQFMEGLRPSGLVSRIPGIGPISDFYSNYLFHEYIPGIKYKTYQSVLDRNLKVYAKDLAAGKFAPEDVKTLSAEQVNAAFGHLNYADLGRNPTIQHIAQLVLLAPDFLEGRARFAAQAIKGVTGAKVGREQLIALAVLAIGQAALAYTSAQLTDGKWDASRPFEFTQGNRRYTMRSVPEDVSSLLHNTRIFVHSRLSPLIGKGTLQYLSGVNALGKKVSAGETTKELAEQPLPISIRGFAGIGNSTLSGMEQLAGAVGLKISRYNPEQAKIDAAMKINDFADSVRGEARKLPLGQRYRFVKGKMAEEKMSVADQAKVLSKLRQHGTFDYQ